jgi:hypothetical protein
MINTLLERNTVEDETYFYYNGMFCPCCGMQLRRTPASKNGKERVRRQRKKVAAIYHI